MIGYWSTRFLWSVAAGVTAFAVSLSYSVAKGRKRG